MGGRHAPIVPYRGGPASRHAGAQLRATIRVPVALNEATAGLPTVSPSRSTEAAVTSAVTGPTRTRTRLPTWAIERISPWITFWAESGWWSLPTAISHG